MTPEQFVYWLQGFFEMQPDLNSLTPYQVAMLRDHLGKVFNRETKYNGRFPNLQELNDVKNLVIFPEVPASC